MFLENPLYIEKLAQAGEHPLQIPGEIGPLEGCFSVPANANKHYIALLGHPHSLQGGSMNNKIVTTLAKTFKELGIASIRMNFRGVGASSGAYDDGIGESEDMLLLIQQLQQERPEVKFILAGFSFGSYVVYRVASQISPQLLITIAPPVHHYDYTEFGDSSFPWIIAQGDEDELTSLEDVRAFAHSKNPPLPLLEFSQTTHFFHGRLIELKNRLAEALLQQVSLK